MDPITKFVMENLIDAASEVIMPLMLLAFAVGIVVRGLIYFTANEELKFCGEFEKRVHRYFSDPNAQRIESFHLLVRHVLGKTYHETFELKHKFLRRNLDYVTSITDRLFLIQDGAARVIQDTLRRTKYMRKDGFPPKMVEVTRHVFENNPVFNRLWGVFPVGLLNDLVNILPGLFIIGGIFGTFLGISKGLPELGHMDMSKIEETKAVMDMFLVKISQAMVKSIIGIALSVVMSLINTVFSPDTAYYGLINRFASSLEQLWNESAHNESDRGELILDGMRNVYIPEVNPKDVRAAAPAKGGRNAA